MTATLTIDLRECDTLHGLLSRRLLILVENPSGFAEVEGITVAELYERLADDLRLMEDIGWASEADQESVALTMPREKLAETLKRLRRDARRAPCSVRHEREPKESVDERWRRFRQAVEVCEELLCRLDSSAHDEKDPEPISGVSPEDAARHELAAYIPVTDGFVLAALERAERHEQEAEVLTAALMGHLGFKWAPSTNRLFFPRLEGLRQAGLLTSIERRGEPYWSLTSVGREQLAKEREAGEVGELPESPQHRAWRHAREEVAVRIDALAIAGSAERHDANDPWVGPFGDAPDDTALAGRVPALEQDDDFQPLPHDPFLKPHQLDLQVSQLLLVLALVEDSRLQTPTLSTDDFRASSSISLPSRTRGEPHRRRVRRSGDACAEAALRLAASLENPPHRFVQRRHKS